MTMHMALHPKDDVDRLYMSRKEIGRRVASPEDSVDASIQRLKDYIDINGGRLIPAIRSNNDDTRISRMEITSKQKYEEKQRYGCFK